MLIQREGIRFQDADGAFLEDCYQTIPKNTEAAKGSISTRYINVNSRNGAQRELPVLYRKAEECCGCSSCYATCPHSGPELKSQDNIIIWSPVGGGSLREYPLTGAITMLPDAEGFVYPVIDATVCIRCYCCVSRCAFKRVEE